MDRTPEPAGLRWGPEGTLSLAGAAERLWLSWILYLRRLLHRPKGFHMWTPALIEQPALERSGYIDHFPQNVLRALPQEELLKTPAARSEPTLALSPASCLHVYHRLAGMRISERGTHGVVCGPCARYEGGRWAQDRLSQFTMLEWVAVASESVIAELDRTVPASVSEAFARLGLEFDMAEATDPFFAGDHSGPAVIQRMTGAKSEWRTRGGSAVASANRHCEAYGERFDIRAGDSTAHSMCVAFGIERLVLESLDVWGESKETWPRELSVHAPLP